MACMVGAIGNLYKSFENLSDTYMQPNFNKDTLLKPNSSIGTATVLSLTNEDTPSAGRKVYICPIQYNCNRRHVSDDLQAMCPTCNRSISYELPYVAAPPAAQVGSSADEGGFVKGVVTYMIMDDLQVKPMSTISGITMLNQFSVKEVGALKERTVSVGLKEVF